MKNTRTDSGKAQVDFTTGRGFSEMGVGLPDNFLAVTDSRTTLLTIAFLYTHPDPTKVNSYGQAMTTLALYGAGALASIPGLTYERLVDLNEEYESVMRAPEPHGKPRNEAFAACVRRFAEARFRPVAATRDPLALTGIDVETGRGFGDMAKGLPEDFLQLPAKSDVLATIALLYTHPDPTRVNTYSQAVCLMALYGAGAQVNLTKQQFRRLEKSVLAYESYMRGVDRVRNEKLAACARKQAVKRAKSQGVI